MNFLNDCIIFIAVQLWLLFGNAWKTPGFSYILKICMVQYPFVIKKKKTKRTKTLSNKILKTKTWLLHEPLAIESRVENLTQYGNLSNSTALLFYNLLFFSFIFNLAYIICVLI